MPKLKSNSSAKKRFRKTAGGYKFASANRRHILTKKSAKRKRRLNLVGRVSSSDELSVKRMMGGS